MSQNPPAPKGRAALLMKMLAQAREQKPGAQPQASEQAEEPPKARGRAALIKKISELRASASKVGGDGPSTSGTAKPEQRATEKVGEVTKMVEETTLAEPRYYRGKVSVLLMNFMENYLKSVAHTSCYSFLLSTSV